MCILGQQSGLEAASYPRTMVRAAVETRHRSSQWKHTCSAILASFFGRLVGIQELAPAIEHEGVHWIPVVHSNHSHLL